MFSLSVMLFGVVEIVCFSTTFGQNLDCPLPFQCSNIIDNAHYFSVACDGYLSCYNSTFTNIEDDIDCDGEFSCIYMGPNQVVAESPLSTTYFKPYHESNGYAASFGLIMDNNNPWEDKRCYGELSCGLTELYLYDDIRCYGSRSCIYSKFTLIENEQFNKIISAYGPFALYGTTITGALTINHGSNIELRMYGFYSGYMSTFNCNGIYGDCILYCEGTGCVGMTINCEYNTSCNIYCDDTISDYCPRVYEGGLLTIEPTVTEINYNTYCINDLTEIKGNLYDFYQLIPLNKEEYEFIFDINTIGDQRSNDTCEKTCNAYEECKEDSITIPQGSACCTGTFGCSETQILLEENGDNIMCNSYFGCYYAGITIESLSSIVYARGEDALSEGTVISNINNGDNSVICTGEESCEYTTITNISTVVCDAYKSCIESSFYNVQNIYAISYASIDDVQVTFDAKLSDNNKLNVFVMSYESVRSLDIICDIDTICTIYCQGVGCDAAQNEINTSTECTCNIVQDFESTNCLLPTLAPSSIPSFAPFTLSPTEEPTMEPLPV